MNVTRRLRRLVSASIALAAARYIDRTWRHHHARRIAHGLPGGLVISLTSYPPRYPTLALTLKSLLAQSVRPDRLDLWIAEADAPGLPDAVRALQADGLSIRVCRDLRSYKKIIPALAAGHTEFIVIADDDVHYPRHWLRGITTAWQPGRRDVICTRAHRIRCDPHGMPLPYGQWESEVAAGEASALLFPTGIGGVLYEPGIFHPDVTRIDLFQALCPTSDDIWLYWMAALTGARFRKIGRRYRPINWFNSQRVALAGFNAGDGQGNDQQVARMVARYGFPASLQQDSRPGAQPPQSASQPKPATGLAFGIL